MTGTLLALLAGCVADCPSGELRADDAGCYPMAALVFPGIETASWDGVLAATWSAARNGYGDVLYTVTVEGPDGEVVATEETAGLQATLPAVDDGEYLLRVVARDGLGRTAGDTRTLAQLAGDNRLVYRSEVPVVGARGIEGEGDLVAVGTGDGVVLIVDLAEVESPVVLARLEGLGEIGDVEIADGILYVACDTALDPEATVAVRVYDLADPAAPALLTTLGPPQDSAHTLTTGGGLLFLASGGVVAIYDVADPANPVRVGQWAPTWGGPHDQAWQDGRLYVAASLSWAVVDVRDPAAPVTLFEIGADWDDPFVHNLSPTADGATLAMSEEKVDGAMRVWDIHDLDAVALASTWQGEATHSVHNVHVRDAWAFAAWFVEGVHVFDLSEPAAPRRIGSYDSFAGDESPEERGDGTQGANVGGAQNVWPYGEHVAVADSQRGVMLFDFFPEVVAADGEL